MKHKLLSLFLLCGMLLSCAGCGAAGDAGDPDALQVAATTYPVYLMAQAVTQDVPGVEVHLVVDQELSCLHDYTLTVRDMQVLERADLVLQNGAGLEDFLSDALDGKPCMDCSEGISLLWLEEDDCDDPHIWMDPENAGIMARNIAAALAQADADNADRYTANADAAQAELSAFADDLRRQLSGLSCRELITFHDGFAYFAQALDLDLLAAVEEEEGGEAPARTIARIEQLVREHHLPAIFTEVNGSSATAETIARECGIQTRPLSMCMSGEGGGLDAYKTVLQNNADTLLEVLS